MKKKLYLPIALLFGICILIYIIHMNVTPILKEAIPDEKPKSIINNYGKDPRYDRNFTWYTSKKYVNGMIQYCPVDEFNGFDGSNIITLESQNHEIKTNLGKREIHKIELNNLQPGMNYIYRVGNTRGIFSPIGVFKTAEQDPKEFTFIHITDTQGANQKDYAKWKNTLDQALVKVPDAAFLLHTGDMEDKGDDINQWDLFSNAVSSEFMNIAVVPVVGNHDAINKNKTNSMVKNFVNKFNLYKEENTGAPLGSVYSFDYGDMHLAVMNTECGDANLKKQADWLRNDMIQSNKKWKIVALHRGPYGATYDTTDIRDTWTPVFDELGIDLVLSGHDHNYVRSYPIRNNVKVNKEKGTIYIVANTGGTKFYKKKTRSWQAIDLQPKIQMYLAVTVDSKRISINSYDVNDLIIDSVVLEK